MTTRNPRVAVVGGGRWAKVIVSVLRGLLPPEENILWVTKHGMQTNQAWLTHNGLINISLTDDDATIWQSKPAYLIIATASHTHAVYVEKALKARIPVLSEKPYAYTSAEAANLLALSQANITPAYVNFEFMFASYLEEFKTRLQETPIKKLEIVWHDVWAEQRGDDIKYGDIYTPIVHDQLAHGWSLAAMLVDDTEASNTEVSYAEDGEVRVLTYMGQVEVTFSLHRRDKARIRTIRVNDNEALLDFSAEPGWSEFKGDKITHVWGSLRPLGASLTAFLDGSATRNTLQACMPAVKLAEEALTLWHVHLNALQVSLQTEGRWHAEDAVTQRILVDRDVPILAIQGERIQAFMPEQMRQFSKRMLGA